MGDMKQAGLVKVIPGPDMSFEGVPLSSGPNINKIKVFVLWFIP